MSMVALKVAVIFLLLAVLTPNVHSDTIILGGIVRDFWPCKQLGDCGKDVGVDCSQLICHPDFEAGIAPEFGMVNSTLGADRKPVFVQGNWITVTNATYFDYFFRDTENMNIPIPLNLTLDNTKCSAPPCNPKIYTYSTGEFYPIDNKGWGNYYNSRNYHFSFELNTRFTYRGNETFSFNGDDDLWVFINNKLVIDLGGVHGVSYSSVNLNTLGLTIGNTYNFDIFFMERHTTNSNFMIETSIALFCPWYDHCDICQGDGQSCCYCDDGNPCTDDICDILTGSCQHPVRTCQSDLNKCTNEVCNNSTGLCESVDVNCNDFTACTVDSCNIHFGCSNIPLVCTDHNACTTDSCDVQLGCRYTPITCNDGNPCTTDSCSMQSGCSFQTIDCNDGNACTSELCTATGCIYTNVSCDDGDQCTFDSCNPRSGCSNIDIDCNDNDYCTEDTCNPLSGCSNTPLTCDLCLMVSCSSNDACNPSTCDTASGLCTINPVKCNDNNLCTTDSCVNGNCFFHPVECSGDPCNPQSCNSTTGTCDVTVFTCDDGNNCTTDFCQVENEERGNIPVCVFQPVVCNAPSCTTSSCNPLTGECENLPISCDDNNLCTNEECTEQNGTSSCNYSGVACNGILCGSPTCDSMTGCQLPICDDDNVCTSDSCSLTGGCIFQMIPLQDDGNYCTIELCDPSVGSYTVQAECRPADRCKCDPNNGCICDSVWDDPKVQAISGGLIAGVTVASVAAVVAAVVGGKKGYDFMKVKREKMSNVNSNPLYKNKDVEMVNPFYKE